MTKREIKRAVLRGLAVEIDGGAINWVAIETEEDEVRLDAVCKELADEFSRRGNEFGRQ